MRLTFACPIAFRVFAVLYGNNVLLPQMLQALFGSTASSEGAAVQVEGRRVNVTRLPRVPGRPVDLPPCPAGLEAQRDVFGDAQIAKQRRLLIDRPDAQ